MAIPLDVIPYQGNQPNSTKPGEKATAQKDKVLRYPYARIDNDSDYLRIEIIKYESPAINLDSLFDVPTNQDVKNPTVKIAEKANFQLPTLSSKVEETKRTKGILHTIYLPIPEQIGDTTQISWGEGKLNPAEAFGIGFGNQFQDNPAAALNAALKALTEGVSGIGADSQALKAIQNVVSSTAIGVLGGNVSANELISRATGQVFNPNLELLFDGVGLRNFQFSFEFFPRNKKEAEQVILIIRTLKARMSAKKNASGNSKIQGVFISAPDLFQLTYMKGGKNHPILNKFKPMALVDLQVNYTGSGTYSTFWDGTPTHITMSLSFKELNPIYSEDYDRISGPYAPGEDPADQGHALGY